MSLLQSELADLRTKESERCANLQEEASKQKEENEQKEKMFLKEKDDLAKAFQKCVDNAEENEKKLIALHKQFEQQTEERQKIFRENRTLETNISKLRREKQDLNKKIENEKVEWKKKEESFRKKLAEAKEECKRTEILKMKLEESQTKEWKNEKKKHEEEKTGWKNKEEVLKTELEESKAYRVQNEAALNKQIETLRTENEKKILVLEKLLENQKVEGNEREEELKAKVVKIQEDSKALQASSAQLPMLATEIGNLRKKVSQLEEKLQLCEKETSQQLDAERDDWAVREAELQRQISKLEMEKNALEEVSTLYEGWKKTWQKEETLFDEKLSNLTEEKRALQMSLSLFRKEANKYKKENEVLRTKVGKFKEEIRKDQELLSEKLSSAEVEKQHFIKEMSEKDLHLVSLRKEHEALLASTACLKQEKEIAELLFQEKKANWDRKKESLRKDVFRLEEMISKSEGKNEQEAVAILHQEKKELEERVAQVPTLLAEVGNLRQQLSGAMLQNQALRHVERNVRYTVC